MKTNYDIQTPLQNPSPNEASFLISLGLAGLTAATAAIALVALSGCYAAGMPYPSQHGAIALIGDKEGTRSFFDGLNALVTNGKEDKNRTSGAWRFRAAQEKEETQRSTFLDTLLKPQEATQEGK